MRAFHSKVEQVTVDCKVSMCVGVCVLWGVFVSLTGRQLDWKYHTLLLLMPHWPGRDTCCVAGVFPSPLHVMPIKCGGASASAREPAVSASMPKRHSFLSAANLPPSTLDQDRLACNTFCPVQACPCILIRTTHRMAPKLLKNTYPDPMSRAS